MTQRLVKPASSAARAIVGERRRGRRPDGPGQVEARDLQAEVERHRILLLAGRRVERRSGTRAGRASTRPGAMDAGEALGGERVARSASASRSWRGRRPCRDRARRARGCGARTTLGGRVEHDRVRPARRGARPARASARGAPRSRPVESITVVSRRAQPLGDDQVEDLERVACWRAGRARRCRRRRAGGRTRRPGRGGTTRAAQCDLPAAVAPTSTTRHGSGRRSGGPSSVAPATGGVSGGAVGADEGGPPGAATAPGRPVAAELALEAQRRGERDVVAPRARRRAGRRSAAPRPTCRSARSPRASR